MADTQADTVEKRAEARSPALLTGKIVYGARDEFSVDCVVRSTSREGARLRASLPDLPERFKLLVYKTGEVHQAEIAWRSASEIGVRLHDAQSLEGPVDPQNGYVRRMWADAILQGI